MRRLAAIGLITVLSAGCGAADLGADSSLPACNSRPVDPAGFEPVATEKIEETERSGYRYAYRGLGDLEGAQVSFYYGVTTDAGGGLPKAGQLPLASVGGGQLTGRGSDWTFTWTGQFPCDLMRVVGSGVSKNAFVRVLALSHVTPSEEEEGEGGVAPGVEGALQEEGELEGEIEGVLPPGGPAIEWVAIFGSARQRQELDPVEQELMEITPRNTVVSRVSCWKGLAQLLDIPRNAYVAGFVAVTGNELDFFIEKVGGSPRFYGQLASRCD